ncbi:hypothetical protein RhiirA5_358617 [Rhizophagus irregularis]|uniref:Uncharacterized protein n=1 Tax=Rhizophagus irregularis TaxID=588596 RepID=A0A2N0PM87_9GLOM|nr:hypothetical protein RhiirA5_358617 [Rhizophagus irregularis]
MEFTDDSEDVEQDNEVLEEPVLPPKESTAPIPLAHVSNTSDNSKEEAWFDEDMFFNEIADDSDDDGYNRYSGYGGYNEYGECDRVIEVITIVTEDTKENPFQ